MGRRKYSDREKAEALAVYDTCRGNLTEAARITGIPDSTLSCWVNGTNGMNDDIPNLRDFKKLDLADKLDTIAHQCAGLLPERLPDANVREIVGAMGQSIEKSQLLRGKPTEITETVNNVAEVIRAFVLKAAVMDNIPAEQAAIQLYPELKQVEAYADLALWSDWRPAIEASLTVRDSPTIEGGEQ